MEELIGCFYIYFSINKLNAFPLKSIRELISGIIFGVSSFGFYLILFYFNNTCCHCTTTQIKYILNFDCLLINALSFQIGCCGADGPNDYLNLMQPLPSQCRDTVTGNPFYHGCVDELTWYFEEKAGWVAGLAMVVCMLHVSTYNLGPFYRESM